MPTLRFWCSATGRCRWLSMSLEKGAAFTSAVCPTALKNSRILYRSILWSAHGEDILHCWYSENFNVEVHAYVENGKYCVVNNTYEPQETTVYCGDGSSFFPEAGS